MYVCMFVCMHVYIYMSITHHYVCDRSKLNQLSQVSSMLQYGAVRCSVVRCAALYHSVLQCAAGCCSVAIIHTLNQLSQASFAQESYFSTFCHKKDLNIWETFKSVCSRDVS